MLLKVIRMRERGEFVVLRTGSYKKEENNGHSS